MSEPNAIRQQLLARWKKGDFSTEAMGRPGEGPLSPTQKGMWFLDRARGTSSVNHIPVCLDIKGRLDTDALRAALQLLASRHDVLRTAFVDEGAEPRQVVLGAGRLPLVVEAVASSDVEARVEEIVMRPFDMGKPPLARVHLLELDASHQVLVIVVHHIIFDGWSKGVFADELLKAYGALVRGEEPALPKVEHNYLTFVEWQKRQLTGSRLQAKVDFWRRKFSDRPQLHLPQDRPKTPTPSYRAATYRFAIDADTASRVSVLSKQMRTTKYSVLLAAFNALVGRLAGQDEVLVATNVANRTRKEFQGILGPLINTVLVRTRVDGEPSFEAMAERVHAAMVELAPHKDVPLEVLLEEIRPQRDPSNPGFVQALFILQNTPMPEVSLPGATVTARSIDSGFSEFELIFNLYEVGGGYEAVVEYWTELYDAESIARFGERFARLLRLGTETPSAAISALPLMSPEEQRVIEAYSAGAPIAEEFLGASPSITVAQHFVAQARRHGGRPAVAHGDNALSYDAVLRRAMGVARALVERGVGPGEFVPIVVGRTIEGLVAQMGVWLAGAAFAPIDIDAPVEKRDALLAMLEAKAVVAEEGVTGLAGPSLVLCNAPTPADDAFEPVFAGATDPAYLIFTSGTTGKPKGVVVEHGSLYDIARAWQQEYALGDELCLLQMGSIAADVFIGDWVKALCAGGEMIICPTEDRIDPEKVAQLIVQSGVTIVEATPGLLIPTGQYMRNNGLYPSSLELVIFGSDYVRFEEFAKFSEWLPDCRVVNGYGLTECTIETSVFELEGGGVSRSGYCPLGRPLPGVSMHVLDAEGQVVPPKVVGELHVGGIGVSRGYLHNEGATDEKFVAHPELGRLFRTGDIALMHSDGHFDLLGRADDTVKVRGYRVAIGEVENALVQVAGVEDAAVVDVKVGGQTDLWAFVVAAAGASDVEGVARTELSRALPGYMVPSRVALIEALPRNANNKVERMKLRAMKPQRLAPASTDGWSATQRKLHAIWAEILEHDDFDLDDSFMAVGGTSAMVLRVFNEIQAHFDVAVRVVDLFNCHSINLLAKRLDELAQETP